MGFQDPWLYIFAFHKCIGKIQWHVLDLTHFSWHAIPRMPCIDKVCPHGFRCVSFPFEGSLFVCGSVVFDADCPLNLVMTFNVQKNCWPVMKKMVTTRSFFASGVREGWTGSSAVIYGHLFVVTEHERTKLKVYDTNNDSWITVDGPPLPEQICKPFSVNCNNSKIYVVGRNLHVAVGCILRLNTENNLCFSVHWQVVEAPQVFSDLAPSSIQVLFA
ncbi:putative kelch-type beta propeller [Helianthus annuus]|nr:putative kelch-type beta propeller [Helianthus annuus]KAJ0746852.1 putative kelch-type beta propeller [Helianthus annuus]KAJ0749532.1 putative kelch-type beta propeller [Helianthus annuus]KAJ0921809.1 putative kelch-type beta propeller [Helianthus annuus]